MRHTRVVCLDLDDTLWDLKPVIERAEQGLYQWFAEHYPEVARRHTVASIKALRAAVAVGHPQPHDLAALRRETYRRLAAEAGCPARMVGEAFEVFQGLRNQVQLFADVQPALESLAARGPLVAMTNGNADLEAIGIRSYFTAVCTAAGVGVAKPDPDFFRRSCAQLAAAPAELLHAGNDPEHDVIVPAGLGITAVWVNRSGAAWPPASPPPGHQVQDLAELVRLLS